MRCLKAALVYFGLVFGTGFVLGALRVPFLVPRWGERAAELAEMPLMLVVIAVSARFITHRFALQPTWRARLAPGLLALALLLGAELWLAVVLQDQSLAEYIASRDPVSGSVYLALLALFALMPWLLALPRSGASR